MLLLDLAGNLKSDEIWYCMLDCISNRVMKWSVSLRELRINLKASGPEVIKLVSCSAQLSMKFEMLISIKISRNLAFFMLR